MKSKMDLHIETQEKNLEKMKKKKVNVLEEDYLAL